MLAARIIGVAPWRIMRRHILPNTLTPVMVAATLNLGLAILSEATLSFLGVGMPITQPLAWHVDPHRQPVSLLRLVVAGGVPGHPAGPDRSVRKPARGLAA